MDKLNFFWRVFSSLFFLVLVLLVVLVSSHANMSVFFHQDMNETVYNLNLHILLFVVLWAAGVITCSTVMSTPFLPTNNLQSWYYWMAWLVVSLFAVLSMYNFIDHAGGFLWSGTLALYSVIVYALTPDLLTRKSVMA